MCRFRSWAAIGGTIAPPLFAVVVISLTLAERTFLESAGWSAVHRTAVEWPSLLALGPYGYVLVATFVACGALVVGCGLALQMVAADARGRAAGVAVVLAGFALALEAFKADPSDSTTMSWHDAIHKAAYPLIPSGALVAAAVLSAPWRPRTLAGPARWSAAAVAVFVVALAATYIDGIAQLARYFLFGAMLVWFELLALDILRSTRAMPRRLVERS